MAGSEKIDAAVLTVKESVLEMKRDETSGKGLCSESCGRRYDVSQCGRCQSGIF